MSQLPLETAIETGLDSAPGGKMLWQRYVKARGMVEKDIVPFIVKEEPNLTDHGPDHLADVLMRAGYLIGEEELLKPPQDRPLKPRELYLLGMAVLFHDVGNVSGRKRHETRIRPAIDYVFSGADERPTERFLIQRAAAAHTGLASDGTTDTLRSVGKTPGFDGEPVRLQEIAAILRFADELAEGQQRTSRFATENGIVAVESEIYHWYARVTEVTIDLGNSRIALSYEIDLPHDWEEGKNRAKLIDLLDMIGKRVSKLDRERRYTGYYSDLISRYKSTTVSFNIYVDGRIVDIDFGEMVLTDLILPNDPGLSFLDQYPHCSSENIIKSIEQADKQEV